MAPFSDARPPRPPDGSGDGAPRRPMCLVALVRPEQGLSTALVQHLAEAIPELDFTLRERSDVDAVWVCGYEPSAAALVRRLRERFPRRLIFATRRGPLQAWAAAAREAGVDLACSWPVAPAEIKRLILARAGAAEGSR